MKIIRILTLLIFISLHAGATGYSHNMFVAHKKLQSGKECRVTNVQTAVKKAGSTKVHGKVSSQSRQPETSITKQFANKLSGMVILNQRVVEEGPASFFQTEDENEGRDSIVIKLVSVVKGLVYTFVGSSSFGKS